MSLARCFFNATGLICSAGESVTALKNHIKKREDCLTITNQYMAEHPLALGIYNGVLPEIPLSDKKWAIRNNQFAWAALLQMQDEVRVSIEKYGPHRVGVIIGTSTSGISEAEESVAHFTKSGVMPDTHHYSFQEMGNTAQFLAESLGLSGPAYSVSTACSSGAKAIAAGRRLIRAGLCDAVIVGGVDTLCKLTVQGFSSLEAVSEQQCNPFSKNRCGINIGEAAALFLISEDESEVMLSGVGEGSDAYHISAPDPSGEGAIRSMKAALLDAGLEPEDIDYINLHGTATALNDEMESRAVHNVFSSQVLCSSTKPFTGHTLGAAGALEAAICLETIKDDDFIPPHIWDEIPDPRLPDLNFVDGSFPILIPTKYALSNSFAFGGNNISLLFGKGQ